MKVFTNKTRMRKDLLSGEVLMGVEVKTGKPVTASYEERSMGNLIVGSIGSGKVSTVTLQKVNQDLDNMVAFINNYPSVKNKEEYRYLNGMSIIDSTQEFCESSLQLVKAHGIPDEAITYINPLDPNTPSINPIQGPVEQVAKNFVRVITALNESKDGGSKFVFEHGQRIHLKHYIYLLKLHDPGKEVSFKMLLDMYNEPELVSGMHEQLKRMFPKSDWPDDSEHWVMIKEIDEWFDINLMSEDVHVQGLRNILNEIGQNPLVRRVLFGKGDFNYDRHLESGGILIVNTAKRELGALSSVIGQFVLMNLQQATFRRIPNDILNYHHIVVRNASDYLYNDFAELAAQTRKYKLVVTITVQTIRQLESQFGVNYVRLLLGIVQNWIFFADASTYDDKYLPYHPGYLPMYPPIYSGEDKERILQGEFYSTAILIKGYQVTRQQRLSHAFIPKKEYFKAKHVVSKKGLALWLRDRGH